MLRLYTRGIRAALQATNLGAWAELVQARVSHLRYEAHPVLQLLRGASHHNEWCLSTPPPGTLIYAMVHVYMLCICVGKTTIPLLQRLRKHATAAIACAEDSAFHDLLRITDIHEWTPVPLQLTANEVGACFLERDWWFRLKRWAVNDCAPVVPGDCASPAPPPQHGKQIHTLTRQLKTTTQTRDFARRAAISPELQILASKFQIPLIKTSAVRGPYLTGSQTPAITRAIDKLVRAVPGTRA